MSKFSLSNLSNKGATVVSLLVLGLGLVVAILTKQFWNLSLLAFGLAIACRQLLLKRLFDCTVTLGTFVFLYLTYQFRLFWDVLVPAPALIAALAIFLLLREFMVVREELKKDKENKNHP